MRGPTPDGARRRAVARPTTGARVCEGPYGQLTLGFQSLNMPLGFGFQIQAWSW